MIIRAAVLIDDKRQNRAWTIPCHRHCDAFLILKEFGYKRNIDYEVIDQGFLDEQDNFYTRTEAYRMAQLHNQLLIQPEDNAIHELYSEDLW